MFCFHDWSIFNPPTKNILVRKIGKKYLYAFFQTQQSERDIALGKGFDIRDYSDLVCYKCAKRKLNLTNMLNKRRAKADKEKAKQEKQKAKANAKIDKTAAILERKAEAILAARKEM